MSAVRFVEMHDAQVRSIAVLQGGVLAVGFEHLPVYREEGPKTERLWSHRALLRAVGLRTFASDAVVSLDNWLYDGSVQQAGDEDASDFARFVGQYVVCAGVSLTFSSGAIVKASFEKLCIRLGHGTPTEELWFDGEPLRPRR